MNGTIGSTRYQRTSKNWMRSTFAAALATGMIGYAGTAAGQDAGSFIQLSNPLVTGETAIFWNRESNTKCNDLHINDVVEASISFGNRNPPNLEDDDGFSTDQVPTFGPTDIMGAPKFISITGADGKRLQVMLEIIMHPDTGETIVPRVTGFRIDPAEFDNRLPDISDNLVSYILHYEGGRTVAAGLTGVGVTSIDVRTKTEASTSVNEMLAFIQDALQDQELSAFPNLEKIAFCYGVKNSILGDVVTIEEPQKCVPEDPDEDLELNGVTPSLDDPNNEEKTIVITLVQNKKGWNPEICTFNTGPYVACNEEEFAPGDGCTPAGALNGLPTLIEAFDGSGTVCTYVGGKRICFAEDSFN